MIDRQINACQPWVLLCVWRAIVDIIAAAVYIEGNQEGAGPEPGNNEDL